jgi:hypothetical protein
LPREAFDKLRSDVATDRSQFYKDLSIPFYGVNRAGADVSLGILDAFWLHCMQAGLKAAYDCIEQFSESDFNEDLKKFDVPTLIIHGDDDQIVPIDASAHLAAKIIKNAELKFIRSSARPSGHAPRPIQCRHSRISQILSAPLRHARKGPTHELQPNCAGQRPIRLREREPDPHGDGACAHTSLSLVSGADTIRQVQCRCRGGAVTVTKVRGQVAMLEGAGGNIAVLSGSTGVHGGHRDRCVER